MQGITSGRVQVLGIGAKVSTAAGLPEPWTLSWSDGACSWAGSGIAAAVRGPDHGALLEAVGRAEVRVESTGLVPPAPWFGGFAFDATAAVDGWWEGFPPAWAVVPRLLLGTDGRSAWLYSFVRVGEDDAGAARERAAAQLAEGQRALVRAPETG